MPSQLRKRKLMAEINVVPYIDVTLVLLVIFIVTAPLLSQGVDVNLPQASSEPIKDDTNREPLIVTVDKVGEYYLNIGEDVDKPIGHQTLVNRVAAVLRHRADTRVLVRGDKDVNYGSVVMAMTLLQRAGAPSVGLITEPPEPKRR